ncbi:MAG TPA: CAAX protease [Anaerolineae bacterium]|nr:CAAX protease [Anaerolineae bacterium]
MNFVIDPLFNLLFLGLVLVIMMALVSPFEALGWWAGWNERQLETDPLDQLPPLETEAQPDADHHVVYLTGIGGFSGTWLGDREALFLDLLAARLPGPSVMVRDVFPFSVSNNPLNGERLLSRLWNWVHQRQVKNSADIFTFIVVVRNLWQVAISSDPRYGPINNLGVAQEISRSLLQKGYQPGSGKTITLIGYSGGAQVSLGVSRYLHRTLEAPVQIFTFGGVMADDPGLDDVEHLYTLLGGKDFFPKLGALLFPGRWPLLAYSHWNKAQSQGRITVINAGAAVIHTGATDYFSQTATLPDGQTHMERSVEIISGIMTQGQTTTPERLKEIVGDFGPKNNYTRYQALAFVHPDYYPIEQTVAPDRYRPIAAWMGRLILPQPEERQAVKGTLFEVYHTDEAHRHLIGQVVNLRYSDEPEVQKRVWSVTKDVNFDRRAEESERTGLIHPHRLNHWRLVNPLESLAGGRPNDDVIVGLPEPVVVEDRAAAERPSLYIKREPMQISGRFYALVRFIGPVRAGSEEFWVVHFNRVTQQFDGPDEVVCLPHVLPTLFELSPSTSQDIEKSPLNLAGWYIYGAQNYAGMFVVQSLAPRELLRLQPQEVITEKKAARTYLKQGVWGNAADHKGRINSVLLSPGAADPETALAAWQEGDQALLASVYGGITGRTPEPYAVLGKIYFGHFSYGTAQVVREPLADELRFEIVYHQIYTNNIDGLIAGTLHWSRYMGDRQWGFAGFRPLADILLKLDAFTAPFGATERKRSALDEVTQTLETMTARYRIGDGTGGTYVAAANNCAQDSNQALYGTLKHLDDTLRTQPRVKAMLRRHPEELERLDRLVRLGKSLRSKLLPFGSARADWEYQIENLGSSLEDGLVTNLFKGALSWRTVLPAMAAYNVARVFLEHGAEVWLLRTNQIGGHNPDIEPLAPFPYG